MAMATYQPPVSNLLTYGSCLDVDRRVSDPERDRLRKQILSAEPGKLDKSLLSQLKPFYRFESWPNYLCELEITAEHIPELIRMATDDELNYADSDSVEVWAPIHAWRCLGLLKAEAAVEPLLSLFVGEEDADWTREEIPWVLGMIGESAIAPTALFLASRKNNEWDRAAAIQALEQIAVLHPALKESCIKRVASQLADFEYNSESLNAFLVSTLIELEAVSKAALIERVYRNGEIDDSVCGTWATVQIELGLAKEEDFDPSELEPEYRWFPPELDSKLKLLAEGDLEPPKQKSSQAVGFGSKTHSSKKKKRK